MFVGKPPLVRQVQSGPSVESVVDMWLRFSEV